MAVPRSLTVDTSQCQTDYFEGDYFNSSGATFTVRMSDGTVLHPPFCAYSPTTPLAFEDEYVDFYWTSNGVTVHCEVPIRVWVSSTLSSISVTRTLDQYAGEMLDENFLTVTASFSNGTTRVVPIGRCVVLVNNSSSNPLQYGSNSISVSFTNSGVTKTKTISYSASYLPSRITTSSSPFDNPKWCLANSSLVFTYPLVDFNKNGHPLIANIVYHSETTPYMIDKFSELSPGWTLSLKQFVINDKNTYKYFNELGEIISFKYASSGFYYDQDGFGYLLTISNNEYTIQKPDGTKLLFDSNGYLRQINYFGDDALQLVIKYRTDNTDLIDKVYYSNYTITYLRFEYSNDILIAVHTYSGSIKVNTTFINYSSSNISSISIRGDDDSNTPLTIMVFSYSNGLLSSIKNPLTGEQTNFTFTNAQINGGFPLKYRLYEMKQGIYYDSSFHVQKTLTRTNLLARSGLIYEIALKNEKNITLSYLIDKYECIASAFEMNSYHTYKSLELNKGESVSFTNASTGLTDTTINGGQDILIDSEKTIDYSQVISHFLSNLTLTSSITLALSFFVKLNTDIFTYAKLTVQNGSSTYYYYKQINNHSVNAIQKVSIPFDCDSTSITLKLSFITSLGVASDVYVFDPVINYGTKQELLYENNNDSINLDSVYKFIFPTTSPINYRICFITLKDLILTANSYIRDSHSSKLLYFNNGHDVYKHSSSTTLTFVTFNNEIVTLANLLSHFYTKSETIIERYNPDRYYSEKYIDSNKIHYYYEANQLTITTIHNSQRMDSGLLVFTKTETRVQKYSRYYQIEEENLSQTIGPNTKTLYSYNSLGDLLLIKKVDSNNEELIVAQYTYNSDGLLMYEDGPIDGVYYNYNDNNNILGVYPRIYSNSALTTLYNINLSSSYDDYYRHLSDSFIVNNVSKCLNSTSFNNKGLIDTIINCYNNNGYNFTYSDDLLTQTQSFVLGNTSTTIETNSTILSANVTNQELSWLDGTDDCFLIHSYDKYNRLYSIGFDDAGELGFYFGYLNRKESSYCVNDLQTISNSPEGYYVTYSYYENSSLKGETTVKNNVALFYKGYSLFGNNGYLVFTDAISNGVSFHYDSIYDKTDETCSIVNSSIVNRCSFYYTYDGFYRLLYKRQRDQAFNYLNTYSYTYYVKDGKNTELLSSLTYYGLQNNSNQYIYKLEDSITYNDRLCITNISSIKTIEGSNTTFSYVFSYDDFLRLSSAYNGGLKSTSYIYSGDGLLSVEYDSLHSITTSYSYNSSVFGQIASISRGDYVWSFTYDGLGNRISKTETNNQIVQSTTTYEYYHRTLEKVIEGNKMVTFSYGPNRIRYRKSLFQNNALVNTTNYIYDGTKLIALSSGDWRLIFLYDIHGVCGFKVITHPSSVSNTDTIFTYIRNELGDIVSILDESGNEVISYTYDEWGNILSSNPSSYGYYYLLKQVNPFRYRGYVYDEETGLYYLNSRYYDPFTHTFLTIDDYQYLNISNITGVNLYCYCNYNPVMYRDENGNEIGDWFYWMMGGVIIIGAIALTVAFGKEALPVLIGAGVGAVSGTIFGGLDFSSGQPNWSWQGAARGFGWGAAVGAISGAAGIGISSVANNLGLISWSNTGFQVLANAATAMTLGRTQSMFENQEWSFETAIISFGFGGAGTFSGKTLVSSIIFGFSLSIIEGIINGLLDYLSLLFLKKGNN